MTLEPLSLSWPVGMMGASEDWSHLRKDFIDDQGLRFFRSGPVCQEPIQGQLFLLLHNGIFLGPSAIGWVWNFSATPLRSEGQKENKYPVGEENNDIWLRAHTVAWKRRVLVPWFQCRAMQVSK